MRSILASCVAVLCACASTVLPHGTEPSPAAVPAVALPMVAAPPTPAPLPAVEVLAADTEKSTVAGATFIAPAGWSIEVRGAATILTPPEGDSHIALVDVRASDAAAAVAAAWAAYRPEATWPVKVVTDEPDRDGWTDMHEAAKLAKRYSNDALGEISVSQTHGATTFDFGEWKSEVATRKNPDGTISFITTVPGISGFEFVVGAGPKRTLIVRDAQHEYMFTEQ
jgi:hypothetical protein